MRLLNCPCGCRPVTVCVSKQFATWCDNISGCKIISHVWLLDERYSKISWNEHVRQYHKDHPKGKR